MSITAEWRERADAWFEQNYKHPFVEGIRKGQLPKESLIHYVTQDRMYLQVYMKLCGLGIFQSEEREDIDFFDQIIHIIQDEESHPHRNLCEVAGVTPESITPAPLAEAAQQYIQHMIQAGQKGFAHLLAAMLPCPWVYQEIGRRMLKEEHVNEEHPFYPWISFYGRTSTFDTTAYIRQRLDQLVPRMGKSEQEELYRIFVQSCQHEVAFWDMAYHIKE